MALSFTHNCAADHTDLSLKVHSHLPPGAVLTFKVAGKDVWVQANQAGFLHLARVCAELGMLPGFAKGTHFHRTLDWKWGSGSPEVTFEVLANAPA